MGLEEEIEDLREEIANTPYNKATEAHVGRLKAKLAEKKEKLENQSSAGGGHGYAVEKHGDATVALVGFPSVGSRRSSTRSPTPTARLARTSSRRSTSTQECCSTAAPTSRCSTCRG